MLSAKQCADCRKMAAIDTPRFGPYSARDILRPGTYAKDNESELGIRSSSENTLTTCEVGRVYDIHVVRRSLFNVDVMPMIAM